MADYCGDCGHLDKKGPCHWGNEYYCEVTCKYTPVNKKACSSFVNRAPGGYQRSGCYITTICCDMLGYADDCEVLTMMRKLRDEYLKTTPEGIKILQEYDQIGPIISEQVGQESPDVATSLLQRFIIPSAQSTKNGAFEEATTIYLNMIGELKARYGLIDTVIDYSIETPIELLGKGRRRLNPTPENC